MRREFVSLTARAQRLLARTAMAATLALGALVLLAWQYLLHTDARRQSADMRLHYAAKLDELRQDWQRSAARLRTQIEFLRLGELEAQTRRMRLQAFFTAQGENRDFAGVLIARADGQVLFSLGCEAFLQQGLDNLQFVSSPTEEIFLHGHCADQNMVYALVQTPLWLGREGRGMAVYAVALDNALLGRLVQAGDQAYLMHAGRVTAMSSGNADPQTLAGAAPTGLVESARDLLRVELPFDHEDNAPRLVVARRVQHLLTDRDVFIATLASSLLITGLLWLSLGLALKRHTRRLSQLSEGAERFIRVFRRDAPWASQLAQARGQTDEIGRLGEAIDRLMEQAEMRLAEQEAYRQTLDLLDEVVVELDSDGRLQRVSSAWARVTGHDASGGERMLAEHIEVEDQPVLREMLATLVRGEKTHASARLRLTADAGEERWLEVKLARTGDGRLLRGVLRDITQSYLQERRITHMALHDALTGLPNRVLLEDRLKIALRLASRSGHRVALGFIDLDHFKNVNDNLGHKTGDTLLVALAQRLRHCLRSGDTLARWGGDEFVVLLPELSDPQAARDAAAKLRAAVQAPIRLEETEFNVTFSLGFALYPDDARDAEVLLAHADRAMFHAKAQGRNAVQFFADMVRKEGGRQEIYIQQRLVAAVREGRMLNHYHPLVDAGSAQPVGVEVLARWHEPDLGWVPPASFIPMAENLGLIGELGEQVWHRALAEARPWLERGLRLNVNLSKRQLFKADLVQHLQADVRAAGLEPAAITLEITESAAALDAEVSYERLRALRAAGFHLAIDDFGTGYSSLAQLHELPVDELKIDMSFVRRLRTPQGARMIHTIVAMAQGLGLRTVAEGVEDAESASRLHALGVDILQGWHYARPMPADELHAWLAGPADPGGKAQPLGDDFV